MSRAIATAAFITLLSGSLPALAATVFGTQFNNPGVIVRIDSTAGTFTPVFTTGDRPDSLVFDAAGRIVYTVFGTNQLRRFDPATNSDVLVASGFQGPLDVALEPGGATVLVSSALAPRIDRVNLTTGTVTLFINSGGEGIAYDNTGRLFANLPGRVAELNPQTGAELQTTAVIFNPSLDGLAFDPATGNLFATDGTGGHLFRLNRNNLAAGVQGTATFSGAGVFADGVVADGAGHVFVAVRVTSNETLSGLFQVDATTLATNQVAFVPVLDDIAPLVGLGAPPAAPPPPPPSHGNAAAVPTLSETLLLVLALALGTLGGLRLRARKP